MPSNDRMKLTALSAASPGTEEWASAPSCAMGVVGAHRAAAYPGC